MTQKQAQERNALMVRLLAVTRQMNRTTDQVEKRHLIVAAHRLHAQIQAFDKGVLFAVV